MYKIILSFFISSNFLFGAASNADIIWTWGNGKSIASILSFLFFLLNIDTISTFIKGAGIIGLLIVLSREYVKGADFKPTVAGIKVFFFVVFSQAVITWFLTVKQDNEHRVYILSANELSAASWAKCRPVNGSDDCFAPLGVKYIFSFLTNFERAGLYAMESAMMDANALTYSFSRMGLGFGFSFYDHVSKSKGDPYTYNTFMDFYENCIIYDLADGTKTVDGLYKSNDLANYMLSSNSRLTNVYTASNPSGTLKTCYEVSSQNLWGNITCPNTAQKIKAKASGSQAAESTTNDICDAAENFGQMMFNSTKDATAQIEQRTIMNMTNEAITNSAISSGIDPSILAYGTAMADREQTSKWMTMGIMAKEWIPSIRGMMQGIAIGLIWVLALISIASASFSSHIGSAIGFQLTLVVWSFILALINFMTIDRMGDMLPNIFFGELSAGDQMTLWSQPTFDEENQKALAFLGYLSVASYGIAAGLVKMGGNMLSSIGGGVAQLSVGMGTSANMAKGHFDGGMDKSDSSGYQKLNRDGSIDRVNPTGYLEHTENQAGHSKYQESISSKYGGTNTMEKLSNADGSSSFKASTSDGKQSVTTDSQGNVTGAEISGIQAKTDMAIGHEIENAKSKAASLQKSANDSVSSSINSTNTSAQQVIESVAKGQGSSAGTEFAKNYNENVQSNLTEAFKEVNGSQETLQKLRGVDMSVGVRVEASASGGFTVFGNGIETKGSVNTGVTGTSSAQSGDRVSIDLSKEEAQALSRSMATGLAVTSKNSDSLSVEQKSGITQTTDSSLTKTNQASHAYAESKSLSETATKMEKDKNSISASLSKDIMFEVAQKTIDTMGLPRGSDELFHNKGLVERTANDIIKEKASKFAKVDTDTIFNKVESGIQQTSGSVNPVNTSNPHNINLNDSHSQYSSDVKTQGEQWHNNMPSTDNTPIHQDTHVETKVEESKATHDARGDSLVMNAIPDVVRDIPNVKFSADGTYTDLKGAKHNWSNKGKTEH